MADLDPAVLVVPALGNILTLAYALGIPIEVDRVDAAYAAAADRLAETFGAMYPRFDVKGFELRGERVGPVAPVTVTVKTDPALLLFSGGADSSSSLIEHRREVRALVTVWGADVRLTDQTLWDQLCSVVRDSELTADRRLIVARANLQDLIDGPALTRKFESGFIDGTWWGSVQHGLALTSVTVPAATALGLSRVLIAGSDFGGLDLPWGSSPRTDNQIRWSGGQVEHDQADLSRADKITKVIAPYVRGGGRLNLAICYQPGRGPDGLNCGRCEKCQQTITQLLLAGIAPDAVGLPISPQSLAAGRRALTRGFWHGDDGHRAAWRRLQLDVPATLTGPCAVPYIRAHLEWFRTAKIVIGTSDAAPRWHRVVLGVQRLGARTLSWLPLQFRKWCSRRVARLLGEG
ncbi:hypothetical protein [Paractinoplanes ferrugineus]|uniref:hypothetical protein n=1 Tax=Paractinoplanes ferrugineus TaxID=113564 RepID=UPI001944E74E|nr:hypothetical protein [Actinoplanes ferrugineus]